jgi:hypothetical protein
MASHSLVTKVLAETKTIDIYDNDDWKKDTHVETRSVFQHLFSSRLNYKDRKTFRYLKREESLLLDLESKIYEQQRQIDLVHRQSLLFWFEPDLLLPFVENLQTQWTRIEWRSKNLTHPFLSKFSFKYFPEIPLDWVDKLTKCTVVENLSRTDLNYTKNIIKHLKVVLNDCWKTERNGYNAVVQSLCSLISTVYRGFARSSFIKHGYPYMVADVNYVDELFEIYRTWFNFILDISFEATLLTKGESFARVQYVFDFKLFGNEHDISFLRFNDILAKGLRNSLEDLVASDIERVFIDFFERAMPDLRLNLQRSLKFNLAACSYRIKAIGAWDIITSSNPFNLSKLHRFQSEAERKGILVDENSDERKCQFLEIYEKTARYLITDRQFSRCISSWMGVCHLLSQFKFQTRKIALSKHTENNSKHECVKVLLSICPSAIVLPVVSNFCLQFQPHLIFDIIKKEIEQPNSRIFFGGGFTSKADEAVIQRYMIDPTPFLKNFTVEQKQLFS